MHSFECTCTCVFNRQKNESSTVVVGGGGTCGDDGGGADRKGMSINNQHIVTPEIYLKNFAFFHPTFTSMNKWTYAWWWWWWCRHPAYVQHAAYYIKFLVNLLLEYFWYVFVYFCVIDPHVYDTYYIVRHMSEPTSCTRATCETCKPCSNSSNSSSSSNKWLKHYNLRSALALFSCMNHSLQSVGWTVGRHLFWMSHPPPTPTISPMTTAATTAAQITHERALVCPFQWEYTEFFMLQNGFLTFNAYYLYDKILTIAWLLAGYGICLYNNIYILNLLLDFFESEKNLV